MKRKQERGLTLRLGDETLRKDFDHYIQGGARSPSDVLRALVYWFLRVLDEDERNIIIMHHAKAKGLSWKTLDPENRLTGVFRKQAEDLLKSLPAKKKTKAKR